MKRLLLWAWIGVIAFWLADISGLFAERELTSQTGSPARPVLSETPRNEAPNLAGTLPGNPPKKTEVSSPPFTLRGTVVGEKASLALVLDEGNFVALAVGETFHGWKLTRVEPERALFEKDGQTSVAALSNEPEPDGSPSPK